jgi:hypothetical protein
MIDDHINGVISGKRLIELAFSNLTHNPQLPPPVHDNDRHHHRHDHNHHHRTSRAVSTPTSGTTDAGPSTQKRDGESCCG